MLSRNSILHEVFIVGYFFTLLQWRTSFYNLSYNIDQNMLHYILIEEIETFIELNPIAISDFLDILSFIRTVP